MQKIILLFTLLFSLQASARCLEPGKIYPVCEAQKKYVDEYIAEALSEDKTLVLVFGADWCPWCVSLHKILTEDKNTEFSKDFNLAAVGMYKEREKLASGFEVLTEMKKMAKNEEKMNGIPLLAVYNPKNKRAIFIDTEGLEKNTKKKKGHDPEKLMAALRSARKNIE